jgi:hypothetical protein
MSNDCQAQLGRRYLLLGDEMGERTYAGEAITYFLLTAPPTVGVPHLEPDQADALQQHAQVVLQGGTIDMPAWIDNLPMPDHAKTVLHEEMEKILPTEKQITIDPAYAEKTLVKKVRFRGDFGLLFEVQAEHYDDVVKGKQEIIQADGQTVTRLTLEVRGWQWVKK